MAEQVHWSIPGYVATCELYRSHRYQVCRGRRLSDGRSVVLKTTTSPFPALGDLAKLKQEFEIARHIQSSSLATYYELVRHDNTYTVVLEDFAAQSLARYLDHRTLAITEFFAIAIALTSTLAELHAHNLIHKNIEPSNILIASPGARGDGGSEASEPASDGPVIKLIDLGISSLLSREQQNLLAVVNRRLEGTLTHMAPEQTGRINRAVDQRADLYGLGVCLYQMLTGTLPFQADDPLELVHVHLTQLPQAPSRHRPEVPAALDAIVLRLLAKTPEERYQSAASVASVLGRCRQAHAQGRVAEFRVEGTEGREYFHISQKLYGRQREVRMLLDAFSAACQGSTELLLVSGYSGIGKTALVYEVQKPIVGRRGRFVAGKFDQYQRNIPYASFVQAFRGLARELLREDPEALVRWRYRLMAVLGAQARLITELLPELETILGPQPALPPLPAEEARHRFHGAFADFLRVFTSEHPIVIFLDDLQWADPGTLSLLEALVGEGRIGNVLFIAAYRDNEVHAVHPMQQAIDRIRARHGRVDEIHLTPLTRQDLGDFIGDTLYQSPSEIGELVELVLRKTAGNPFFVRQLLTALHDDGDLAFEPIAGAWQWDLKAIERRAQSDNVVDLMVQRIHTLPPACAKALQLAACIGNSFDLYTLVLVSGSTLKHKTADLWPALQSGLIVPVGDGYRTAKLYDDDGPAGPGEAESSAIAKEGRFAFLHDRVQQAAYSMVSDSERNPLHLRIARLWMEGSDDVASSKELFDIVNHYNIGLAHITQDQERYRLVELNLAAAQRTQASSAFAAMLQFALAATEALPAGAWQYRYDLACAVAITRSEAEGLRGDYERALAALDQAQAHVRNTLDVCHLVERKILFYKMSRDLNAAFATSSGTLAEFDIHLPRSPNQADLRAELARTEAILAGRSLADLAELPEMASPQQRAICRILQETWPVGFFLGSLGMHIVAMKMVQLSAQHGNCPASAFGYMVYAFAQVFQFDNIDEGYRMGQVSLMLHERFEDRTVEAKILDMWGGLIQHYKEPIRCGKETLYRGFIRGMEAGDHQWASYCAANYGHLSVVGDGTLSEAAAHLERALSVVGKYDQTVTSTIQVSRETVASLIEGKDDPVRMVGRWADEDFLLRSARDNDDITSMFYVYFYKLIAAVVFDRREVLLSLQKDLGQTMAGGAGVWPNPVSHYLRALALLRVVGTLAPDERARHLDFVDHVLEKMRQWQVHAPENYTQMYELIAAEKCRLGGEIDRATRHYDAAIEAAREHGFIHDQALAAESAARCYRERGADKVADVYLREARYCYQRWGAHAKVAQLDDAHPQLRDGTMSQGHTTAPHQQEGMALDLLAVLRASHAISGELQRRELLQVLMRTMAESAGADRAILIFRGAEQDALTVEAVYPEAQTPLPIPLLQSQDVPHGLVQLVARVGHTVRVGDVAAKNESVDEAYVRRARPRSVLCMPLTRLGQLIGVLYLENRLTPEVFTEERQQVLELLAAQAVVSIENARLYDELEQRVEARTQELERAQNRLADMARQAGMAEVATNILHSVGNLLTGVNAAVDALREGLGDMHFGRMEQLSALVVGQERDEPALASPLESAQVSRFLNLLAGHYGRQRQGLDQVVEKLAVQVERIGNIVLQQQELVSSMRVGKTVDVIAEVEDALALCHSELEEAGITCKRHYLDRPEVVIEQHKLQQILRHLIKNARQALDVGPMPRFVDVYVCQPSADEIWIEVADNGVGIDGAMMERIFQPGFTTHQGNQGLGLHYAINAAREMGGDLRVQSDGAGRGARFRLVLPVRAMVNEPTA